MRRKTPQERKRLSYLKDRRNDYGENDKSSRKNIPRNKRIPNRANRHRAHQVLLGATGAPHEDGADATEQRLRGLRPKRWRKYRDTPLGEYLAWKLAQRQARDHR